MVTISGGIGEKLDSTEGKSTWEEVVAEADRGLYKAKRNGRNQVAIDLMERDFQTVKRNN
ncbi:MAG: hypothetical protein ABGX83_05085 [Nitrospira sp.]